MKENTCGEPIGTPAALLADAETVTTYFVPGTRPDAGCRVTVFACVSQPNPPGAGGEELMDASALDRSIGSENVTETLDPAATPVAPSGGSVAVTAGGAETVEPYRQVSSR